ncbi:hypothetical protein FUAX_48680 (plasmid) [Fulvitalea axinellae]|uniref:Bacterial transcriptional activator domain-containing protein n=1 Tax=Fulvitalea axinellae TaxID=1182444 RepID=A0AAU9CTQ7_9BACT|nr:hypothetical protein FUAX_48680 [Fulvitalea axinellae]
MYKLYKRLLPLLCFCATFSLSFNVFGQETERQEVELPLYGITEAVILSDNEAPEATVGVPFDSLAPYGSDKRRLSKLSYLDFESGDWTLDSVLAVWNKCGYPPRFVIGEEESATLLRALCDSLNSIDRVKGRVDASKRFDCEGISELGTDRYFGSSFILPNPKGEEITFRPYKPGYLFFPAEITFGKGKENVEATFRMYRLDISAGVVAHYLKSDRFVDLWDVKASVGYGREDDQTSVSVLLKGPEQEGEGRTFHFSFRKKGGSKRQCLLSGRAFDLLLDNERLILSGKNSEGEFILKEKVPDGVTHDLAITSPRGGSIAIFLDGDLLKKIPGLALCTETICSYTLGRNAWGETFLGNLSDFVVWGRILSSMELELLASSTQPIFSLGAMMTVISVVLLLVVLVAIYIIVKRKLAQRTEKNVDQGEIVTDEGQSEYGLSIRIIGGFVVEDSLGVKHSGEFTPKLREIMTWLLVKHVWGDSFTTKEINKALWPNTNMTSANNSRSTLFSKLRKVLDKLDIGTLVFESGKWEMRLKANVRCDLEDVYARIVVGGPLVMDESVMDVLSILSRGALAGKMEGEWLKSYRQEIRERVCQKLWNYEGPLTPEEAFLFAEALKVFDPIDPKALEYGIRANLQSDDQSGVQFLADDYRKNYFRTKHRNCDLDLVAFVADIERNFEYK